MKKFLALLLVPVAMMFGQGESSSSMTYVKAAPNAETTAPELGIGQRVSIGRHGLDLSYATADFFNDADLLSRNSILAGLEVDYLLYFNPESTARGYMGLGAKPGYRVLNNVVVDELGVTPQAVLGYEFAKKGNAKGFVQLEVRPLTSQQNLMLAPVSVGVGIGF